MPDAAAPAATPSPSQATSDLSWRAPILEAFAPATARLSVAFDLDGVLAEVHLAAALRQRGFYLLPWGDPAAFRHRLETEFRSRWNAGEDVRVVAVCAQPTAKPPYDFIRSSSPLSFSVKTLFPRFTPSVVAALDRADFDALALADRRHEPAPLDETATADFLLRHLYDLSPERLCAPVDLLHFLLRQHYAGRLLPQPLDQRIIAWCGENRLCADWPLTRIVPDRSAFFSFLQEHWEAYIRRLSGYRQTPASGTPVPIDHERVRGYWDPLFYEGWLKPANHCYRPADAPQWLRAGLHIQTADPRADQRRAGLRRWEGLLFALESGWPAPDARLSEMTRFHRLWREWTSLTQELPKEEGASTEDDPPGTVSDRLPKDGSARVRELSPGINDLDSRVAKQVELQDRWEVSVRRWLAFHDAVLPFIPASLLTFTNICRA